MATGIGMITGMVGFARAQATNGSPMPGEKAARLHVRCLRISAFGWNNIGNTKMKLNNA